MHPLLTSLTRVRFFRLLLLAMPLLLLGGCGGGGSDTPTTNTSTAVVGPKTMVGAVVTMTYSDGRTYTFNFASAAANGVTRSDGKATTNWTSAGQSSPVVTIDLAYGAFTAGSLNNVFDDYGLTFTTKTTGTITLRENTTSNTFQSTSPMAGSFTITTYPPNG
jgi:hypothetical protein